MQRKSTLVARRQCQGATWFALTVSAIVAASTPARAVTILEDNTNPGAVSDLTGFATTGSDMAGALRVTAFFTDGTSETIPWASTGVGDGAALGTGWTLREFDDTFGSPASDDIGLWKVTVQQAGVFIDQLLLSGVNPNIPERGVVFDRTKPTPFGTQGSYRGRDFEVHTTATVIGFDPGFDDFEVTYRMPIDSQADGPGVVGDLFGELLIDPIKRSGELGFFYALNELSYYADTDTVGMFDPGSFDPNRPELFPEPTSLVLLALGGFIGLCRRP